MCTAARRPQGWPDFPRQILRCCIVGLHSRPLRGPQQTQLLWPKRARPIQAVRRAPGVERLSRSPLFLQVCHNVHFTMLTSQCLAFCSRTLKAIFCLHQCVSRRSLSSCMPCQVLVQTCTTDQSCRSDKSVTLTRLCCNTCRILCVLGCWGQPCSGNRWGGRGGWGCSKEDAQAPEKCLWLCSQWRSRHIGCAQGCSFPQGRLGCTWKAFLHL